jgi:hypothetical protein
VDVQSDVEVAHRPPLVECTDPYRAELAALVHEAAWWTTPVQTATFGLLLPKILSRPRLVVGINVHRRKPRQLVLVAADIHGSRRPLLARPWALHGS